MGINHFAGIGDAWLSVQSGDFAAAKRLGQGLAEDCG
jgi:hypothetical protein